MTASDRDHARYPGIAGRKARDRRRQGGLRAYEQEVEVKDTAFMRMNFILGK